MKYFLPCFQTDSPIIPDMENIDEVMNCVRQEDGDEEILTEELAPSIPDMKKAHNETIRDDSVQTEGSLLNNT